MTMISLTTGTAFIMWLGEQITERGIGNGISLIIFAGIVCDMPDAAVPAVLEGPGPATSPPSTWPSSAWSSCWWSAAIIFFERGQRRIPVQYAKRVVGRKMFGGQSTHLPLKVNTAGVIPPIFASSILMFPQQIASFVQTPWMKRISEALHPGDWRYNVIYVGLIVFFCYFYTAVTFNPVDVADNMKKYGGFIPGIRPGKATAAYIDKVLTRITFGGAVYISAICVLPVAAAREAEGAVLLRRHRPDDRRRRRAGHRSADRIAPHHPELRRVHRTPGPAYPRPRRARDAARSAPSGSVGRRETARAYG